MGYYRAGDYYRGGGYYRAGSVLSSLGKVVGGVAKAAVSLLPGPVGTVARGITSIVAPARTPATLALAALPQRPEPGIAGAVHRLVPGGSTGFLARRHMNPGNAKAARRAIRRITSVRKMLVSIERQMPHRACTRAHAKHR